MFNGRVGIVQRILADYRKPFFEKLADSEGINLSVFAGKPLAYEGLKTASSLGSAQFWKANNRYFHIPSAYLCWQSSIEQWLSKFDPDALILEASPRLLSNKLAIKWMRKRKRPALGWGLGELPRSGPAWQQWVRSKVARRMARGFDGIIAYSSKGARDYENAGVNSHRVFVAHNAIDNSESEKYMAELMPREHWIKTWKESLNLHPDLPTVLFVGRLVTQKRVDLLIEACRPLFPRCQLLIVGEGPSMAELKTQAEPYGQYVCFAGHCVGVELAKCFLAADIFVLPGRGGLAVYQAMSYGKPVIVSLGDGTEEDLLRDGLNGLFFRVGEAADLRDKISCLLFKPSEKLQVMGEASLEIVRQEMSMDNMVSVFKNALTQMTEAL